MGSKSLHRAERYDLIVSNSAFEHVMGLSIEWISCELCFEENSERP